MVNDVKRTVLKGSVENIKMPLLSCGPAQSWARDTRTSPSKDSEAAFSPL